MIPRAAGLLVRTLASTVLPLALARPAPAGAADGVPNLLPDASFEQAAADGSPGWAARSWQGGAGGRWAIASPGRTGGRCAAIASDTGLDAAWTATVDVEPDRFYRLSGWIRAEGVRGARGALLNIQDLQHVRTPAVTGTRDWTRVSTVFHTGPATTLEINCLFGGWGAATGQAWYDDLVLEPVDGLPGEARAVVAIDDRAPTLPYSRLLFGGFIEHFHRQVYGGLFEPGSPLSDERGFRRDVLEAVRELKLSVVRWPGGCFASGYHWRDGVGPDRRPTPDPVWGVTDPNTFGTAEFVAWCRLAGCEPYICTNAGNGTPEEMADWVAYCNARSGPAAEARRADGHPEPLGVRYWSIGNENWGGHEIGARTPGEWGPLVRAAAAGMRAVDPDLRLLAAATPDPAWTLPLLEAAGPALDLVAIHEYWLPLWGEHRVPGYLECIVLSEGPESTISRVVSLLEASGHRGRIRIAFDEWNLRGWHHPGFPRKTVGDPGDPAVAELVRARDKNAIASQYTMADALFSASFLNACLRHADDVGMANIAPIVNTRGPLYVHPGGIVRRTTFHVLAMYANRLGERVAPAEAAAVPLHHAGRSVAALDALATRDAAGTAWRIALVNRHPSEPLPCAVTLGDRLLDGTYPATVLDGDSPDAYNAISDPDRVTPRAAVLDASGGCLRLPPHSLVILEVPAGPAP